MKDNKYNKWYLVLAIFAIISMFFGGSLAYWQWTTNTAQRTNIVLTVEPTFMCEADGGGNISSGEKYLVPTDCTNSEYAIKRTITVTPTIYGEYAITMDLWLDVKQIGTGLSNSNNFKYALTTDPNSCTSGLVKSGNFKGKKVNDKVELFNYMGYTQSTTDTFYLYVWLDKEETNSNTMNQNFSLSLNGMCTDAPEPATYVVYNEEDTTLRLYKRDGNASQVSNNQNSSNISRLDNNIQTIEDLTITDEDKITFDLENTTYNNANQLPWYEYRESITRVIFEDEIKPKSMKNWFSGMTNVEYIDVSKVNTSRVTDMGSIFNGVGNNVTDTFEIIGLDNWNVSNVTNMHYMFESAGQNATTWSIGDLSGWNTSSVTNMARLFTLSGNKATNFNIGNISNWNTSKVTSMLMMFYHAGQNATTWSIGDLSNWIVSSVEEMNYMFQYAGNKATIWNIGNLSNWDVSNVTNMSTMFYGAGSSATIWNIGYISNWNVSSVTNMASMFRGAGENATTFDIGNLLNWNLSNVTNTSYMFRDTGKNAATWSIGDLSNWNVSSVTNMKDMFLGAGYNSGIFNIGNLSNWNVSNVTDMSQMFMNTGKKATYSIDLSGWNVELVTNYTGFNSGVESKITPPVWNTTS